MPGPGLHGIDFAAPSWRQRTGLDDFNPGVRLRYLASIVGRTVVDHNDLEINPGLLRQGLQAQAEALFFISSRDDDRDLHPSRLRSCPCHKRIRYYKCVQRAWFLPAALTFLLSLLLSACDTGSRPPHIGKNAPDFTVQDANNRFVLSQFRGKVVVLNFWATWCAPCVEEMPSLVQMQQRLKDRGVTVLAVSVDTNGDAYQRFLRDHNISLLTVRDDKQQSSNLYGTFKFPETYVIDRNGIMRRKFIGAVDWSQPEVVDFLSKL